MPKLYTVTNTGTYVDTYYIEAEDEEQALHIAKMNGEPDESEYSSHEWYVTFDSEEEEDADSSN